MFSLAILWLLCPLGLIPAVIILGIQNSKLKTRNFELERAQGYRAPQQQSQMVPQPQVIQQPAQQPQQVRSQQPIQQPQVMQQPVQRPAQATVPVAQQTMVQQPAQVTAPVVKRQRAKISTMNLVFFIGVLFVIVAGIIFTTTTWRILPNIVKVMIIFALIILFFATSVFSNRKLHLSQTSLTFYSLGSLFIPVSLIGMGHFEMLGSYLSLDGDGKFLLGVFAAFLLTIACTYGAKCYRSRLFVWFSYGAETAAVFFLFWQVSSDSEIRCLLLALYCTLIVLLKGKVSSFQNKFEESDFLNHNLVSAFSRYADIVFYVIGAVLFVMGLFNFSTIWTLTLLCILFSMTWAIIVYEQHWMHWIHPFVMLSIAFGISTFECFGDYQVFVFEGLCFLAFLLYRFIRCEKELLFRTVVSDILFYIACGVTSLIYLSISLFSDSLAFVEMTAPIAASVLMLFILIVHTFSRKEEILGKFAAYLLPWNALYILYWVNGLFEESIMSRLFLIFFIFLMLFTLLLMLVTKRTSILRRVEYPFSIMLAVTGVIACIVELTVLENHYEPVYLWLFTLYAAVKLYEKLSARNEAVYRTFNPATSQTEPTDVESNAGQAVANVADLHRGSQFWLYLGMICATFASITTLYEACPDMKTEHKLLLLLGVTMLLLVVELFLPPVQRLIRILEKDVRLFLTVLLHIYFVTLFIVWYVPEPSSAATGLVLILAVAVCQLVLYRQNNTIAGFVSMILLQPIVNEVLLTFDLQENVINLILVAEMLALLTIGRFVFRNVIKTEAKTDEKSATYLIDWIGICAIFAPLTFLVSSNELWGFAAKFMLVIYALNFLKRVKPTANKLIYTVVAGLLCNALATQPFVKIPRLFMAEVDIIAVLLFAACLYKMIWKGYEKYFAWVLYAAISMCFIYQFFDAAFGQDHVDILIFLVGVLIVAVSVVISKSRRYSVMAQVLLLFGLMAVSQMEMPVIGDVMVHINYTVLIICAALCQWALYRRRCLWAGAIPVIILLSVYGKWINLFDFATNVRLFAWLLMFLSMLVLSRFLHHEKTFVVSKEEVLIDWYAILNIVPTIILLAQWQEELWHFAGLMMLIMYLMSFYRRIHEKADQFILTAAFFVMCIAWWTQPFFTVPDFIQAEWNMVALVLFTLYLYKGIWKQFEKAMSWLFCIVVAACMVWQGIDAVRDKELIDVLILGIAALVILLVSFWIKSKRWFLLAAITLVTLIVYISRDFWLSLAWWVYLLATGIILITLASVNEYYKKKGEKKESKFKRLMQEWEW